MQEDYSRKIDLMRESQNAALEALKRQPSHQSIQAVSKSPDKKSNYSGSEDIEVERSHGH